MSQVVNLSSGAWKLDSERWQNLPIVETPSGIAAYTAAGTLPACGKGGRSQCRSAFVLLSWASDIDERKNPRSLTGDEFRGHTEPRTARRNRFAQFHLYASL